jgi:nucleoid-associated protein YgaU
MELIIPEVKEYTAAREEAQEQANLSAIDLGASDNSDQADEVERSIASIGEAPDTYDAEMMDEDIAEDFTEEVVQEKPVQVVTSFEENFEIYTVQKNDSLMLISFKLYNKFGKWRELAEWNDVTNLKNYNIQEGDQIKYRAKGANKNFATPDGNPYLVKKGDYLGVISKKVYDGNARFWYDIWKNNSTLIQNPNQIFTGFTIYTESFEQVIENEKNRKGKVNPELERSLANKRSKNL